MATTKSITLDEITLMTKPICADTRNFVSTNSAGAEIDSRCEPWPRAPPNELLESLPSMSTGLGIVAFRLALSTTR